MPSGSQLVSTRPMIGIRRRWASRTAIDLGLEVDHEHRVGQALHVLDAAEVGPELLEVGLGGHALARRQQRELALGLVALEVVQAPDAQRDRLEVRQQAAEPAVVDVRLPAASAISLMASRACFLVPTNSTVPPRWATSPANSLRLLEQGLGLQQVDDVDAAALAMDEAAHLGVPAARLVAEVHAGLQQLPDSYLSHGGAPLFGFGDAARAKSVAGPGACAGQGRVLEVASCAAARGSGMGTQDSLPPCRQVLDTGLRWSSQRAGPPFPYLRWIGSLSWPVGRSSRAALPRSARPFSARSRAPRPGPRAAASATSTRSPVTGCGNASRGGVQELPPQPVAPGAPYSGSPSTGMPDRLQVGADLVRAAGLEPHAQQRRRAAGCARPRSG